RSRPRPRAPARARVSGAHPRRPAPPAPRRPPPAVGPIRALQLRGETLKRVSFIGRNSGGPVVPKSVSQKGPSMDLHIKKVWLPGAASCLLFFGFYYVLIWLPFDKNRFQFMAIPYLVLPFAGALAAYWSRRMKGSVLQR